MKEGLLGQILKNNRRMKFVTPCNSNNGAKPAAQR